MIEFLRNIDTFFRYVDSINIKKDLITRSVIRSNSSLKQVKRKDLFKEIVLLS